MKESSATGRDSLPRRLLLISCSRQKRQTRSRLPAIERYDGPAFRVLRRYMKGRTDGQPEVLILSAKWGLISGDTPLPNYNCRMTTRRAGEMRPLLSAQLRKILGSHACEVFVAMDDAYWRVINLQELSEMEGIRIYSTRGGRGRRLAGLYDWLHGDAPPALASPGKLPSKGSRKKVHLRGVEVDCSRGQALALARRAFRHEVESATRVHSWYVQLGQHRVSPKWLVSKLTGLTVSAFVTDEARRVLAQLRIEVRRACVRHEVGRTAK